MIGKTISHYEIRDKLGAGGMGVVYKAWDLTLKRFVALKFLPPDLTRDDDARARFIHEAQAAAALDHPNICTVYEIGEDDGNTFIVMPLVDGGSLRERIREGPLPLAEALGLAKEVARGLSKAHQSGIVHRDIKPANILLSSDGTPRIADFGLAKLQGQTKLTQTGMTVGTLSYMSPEQAQGAKIDGRSDVYSLGAVLYEALTGAPPFEGDHQAAVLYSIINVDPEPLSVHRDDLPDGVQNVIDRALAKDPDQRYESADALIADLEILQSSGEIAPMPKPPRRVKRAWIVAAMAIVVAFVAGYIIQSIMSDGSVSPPEGISEHRVAVFPFKYQGGPDDAYLETAMVDLLGSRFEGAGGLRAEAGAGADDPGEYADEAEDAGAGLYVTGSIVEAGGNVSLSASLYRTGEPSPLQQASAEGPDTQLPRVVDKVAADLLAGHFSRPNERATQVARETAGSFEAFKWYLTGESLARTGRLVEGVEALERAVGVDTAFAMAYFRLACAAEYTAAEFGKARTATASAYQFSSDLPERERLTIEGKYARCVENDLAKAERLYGRVISRYPDDVDANMGLADILGGGMGSRGEFEEARSHCLNVLSSIPDHYGALTELYMVALGEGDTEERTRWARRRLEVSPDGEYAGYDRVHLIYEAGEDSLAVGLDDLLRSQHDQIVIWCVEDAAMVYQEYADAADYAAILTEPSRPSRTRARGHMILAYLDAAHGRWTAAQGHMAAALPLDSAEAIELSAELCVAPLMPVTREELENARDGVSQLERFYGELWSWFPAVLKSYAAGMLNARTGRTGVAERDAATLDSIQISNSRYALYARDLARCVRAEAAWASGDSVSAEVALAGMRPDAYEINGGGAVFTSETHVDYVWAGYLGRNGRAEEAIGFYSGIDSWIWNAAYLPAKHLELGELYEASGYTEKAIEHYTAFVDLWKDCDPELRSVLTDVEARMTRLNP